MNITNDHNVADKHFQLVAVTNGCVCDPPLKSLLHGVKVLRNENITNLWNVAFLSVAMLYTLQYEHCLTVTSMSIVGMLSGFNVGCGDAEWRNYSSEKWSEHIRRSLVEWISFSNLIFLTHDFSNSGCFIGNLCAYKITFFQNIKFSQIIYLQN